MRRVEIIAKLSEVTLQAVIDDEGNVVQIEGLKDYGDVEEFEVLDVIEELD